MLARNQLFITSTHLTANLATDLCLTILKQLITISHGCCHNVVNLIDKYFNFETKLSGAMSTKLEVSFRLQPHHSNPLGCIYSPNSLPGGSGAVTSNMGRCDSGRRLIGGSRRSAYADSSCQLTTNPPTDRTTSSFVWIVNDVPKSLQMHRQCRVM